MTWLNRGEILIGVIAAFAALAIIPLHLPPASLALADLFRWSGILVLAQGLLRDLAILAVRRARPVGVRRLRCLCVESSLGLLLLGLCLLLGLLGGGGRVELPWPVLAGLGSALWFIGHLTRDLVIEIRREPDHLSLIVG